MNEPTKPDGTQWPVKPVLVALDETRYYNIKEDDKPFIKEILGIYLLNRGEVTYCCEVTPSYWLEYVSTAVVLNEPDASEDHDLLSELDERYAHEGGDDCYMHASRIDAFIDKHLPLKDWRVWIGEEETPTEDRTKEEIMEDVREYVQGNCPLG